MDLYNSGRRTLHVCRRADGRCVRTLCTRPDRLSASALQVKLFSRNIAEGTPKIMYVYYLKHFYGIKVSKAPVVVVRYQTMVVSWSMMLFSKVSTPLLGNYDPNAMYLCESGGPTMRVCPREDRRCVCTLCTRPHGPSAGSLR